VTLLHTVVPQTFDESKCGLHIIDLFIDGVIPLKEPNFLIEPSNLIQKGLILFLQGTCIDLPPGLILPIIILNIDQRDDIPHRLQILQIGHALLQWLVLPHVQLKQVFELGVLLGLVFEVLQLGVVIVDDFVFVLDLGEGDGVVVAVWQVGFEIGLEVVHLLREVVEFLLDLYALLDDKSEDILLNLVNLLIGLIEGGKPSLDTLYGILLPLLHNGHRVLLELHNHTLHPLDHHIDLALDFLDFGDVLHDVHQQLSVLLFLFLGELLPLLLGHDVFWVDLKSLVGAGCELFQVLVGGLELVYQEVCVDFDPLTHLYLQGFD
jgi:hypothetical protein